MNGDYTRPEDCDYLFDYLSYQVGLKAVPDEGFVCVRGEEPPSVWQWNVYGGPWHLMAGEQDSVDAARTAAQRWVRENADEVMHSLNSGRR